MRCGSADESDYARTIVKVRQDFAPPRTTAVFRGQSQLSYKKLNFINLMYVFLFASQLYARCKKKAVFVQQIFTRPCSP